MFSLDYMEERHLPPPWIYDSECPLGSRRDYGHPGSIEMRLDHGTQADRVAVGKVNGSLGSLGAVGVEGHNSP